MSMFSDALIEKALDFRRTKLWKKLTDTNIFAVRHADGAVSYCSVMGMMGDLIAIAAYQGQAGLDSIRSMLDDRSESDDLGSFEQMMNQDCLMVSFDNKSETIPWYVSEVEDYCARTGRRLKGRQAYPSFERMRPGVEHWRLEDADEQRRMVEALEAAIEVGDRLTDSMVMPEAMGFQDQLYDCEVPMLSREGDGFVWGTQALPPREAASYETAPLPDEMTLARLRKLPKRGRWSARMFMHIEPVADSDGEYVTLERAPWYPLALILIENSSGRIVGLDLTEGRERRVSDLGAGFIQAVSEHGKPACVWAKDERTRALLQGICDAVGVRIELRPDDNPTDEALQNMLEHFTGIDDDEVTEEDYDEMCEVLGSKEMLRSMPDDMLKEILNALEPDTFPQDVMSNLFFEARRRGLIR